MAKHSTSGIFCLQGDWEKDLRHGATMRPVFDLLGCATHAPGRYIRRDIGTATEFEYYLNKWTQQRYRDYPILYLGFHGDPGVLYLGDRNNYIDLDWLEERLAGKCKGRIIHFGACGTMATHGKRLARFLTKTKALAVCGYRTDVDWMLTAAFEIILMGGMQMVTFSKPGMKSLQRRVRQEAGGLVKKLEFRMVVAS